jgi:hypothetical protein
MRSGRRRIQPSESAIRDPGLSPVHAGLCLGAPQDDAGLEPAGSTRPRIGPFADDELSLKVGFTRFRKEVIQ